jgi:hypothetical protein
MDVHLLNLKVKMFVRIVRNIVVYDLENPKTFVVLNCILKGIGKELFKTHKPELSRED